MPAASLVRAVRSLAIALLTAAPLAAQSCFAGDFGASLGYGTTDTVYPMQALGFAFPLGGATYTHIHINDHGFVELSNAGVPAPLASGSSALYTPTVANFTAGAPKVAALYSDMTLAGGGECFFQSLPTHCTVTWHNVQSYGIPTPRFSFQLVLYADGTIRFVYGPLCTNNSTFGGSSAYGIVGVTPAGGVAAPASLNLSTGGVSASTTTYEQFVAAGTFDMAFNSLRLSRTPTGYVHSPGGWPSGCATANRYGAGCDGLALGAIGLPTFGNTNFALRAEALPAISPLAFFAFGTAVLNPGAPLGPLLGMTGCTSYSNADLGIFSGSPATPSWNGITPVSVYGFAIPYSGALMGTTLSAQALALSTANPFGLVASNGVAVSIGDGSPNTAISTALGMVAIPAGTFTMGSTLASNEQPVRQVTMTQPFWMGRHEVTQAQYQAVMGNNPSSFQGPTAPNAANRPVEFVTWSNAMDYCAALTAAEAAASRLPAGYQYRLPTEAEWEYCCRAGTTTPWNTGASLTTAQANVGPGLANPTYPTGQTAVVGSYAPNAWGLYDMHGNVAEWCLDTYALYNAALTTDPFVAPPPGTLSRVMRGGSWFTTNVNFVRSAARDNVLLNTSMPFYGFRVVLAPVLAPNTALGMVRIERGTYQRGSNAGASDEQPVHQVTLSQPFWIARDEVSQQQFQSVTGYNPSYFQGPLVPGAATRPVEQMTWQQANSYCAALTTSERNAGRVPMGYQYRLPTEAEWEYCCRAGTTTEWNTGASLTTAQANFLGVLASTLFPTGQTNNVGSYAPNAWGLYNMHGNVWEWTLDAYTSYPSGPVTDPFFTIAGGFRVLRGGGWPQICTAFYARSAVRGGGSGSYASNDTGFRVVLAPIRTP